MTTDIKQLYNIETDTLITLHAKGMLLEVRNKSTETYRLNKPDFTILYLLCISHPNIVPYEEIVEILSSVDIHVEELDRLHRKVSNLRKKLKGYEVKDLIINVRGTGYAISTKWVEPHNIGEKISFKNKKLASYVKRLAGIVTRANDLCEKAKIAEVEEGWMVARNKEMRKEIEDLIDEFNGVERQLLKDTCMAPYESRFIRLQSILATFRTYIGMSRVSEYKVTPNVWKDWFSKELDRVHANLVDQLKLVDN